MAFVSVMVPEERVLEVYALLAPEQRTGRDGAAARPEPDLADGGEAAWPEDVVLRAARESAEAMRGVLRILVEAGDDGLTTVEIADQLHLARGAASVAGMLGAFSRRCFNRYGMSDPLWEAQWEELEDGGTTTRLSLYEAYRGPLRRFFERNGD